MSEKRLRAFGFGGQGIITLTHLVGEAAVMDGREVIMTEEYSPYITGGWSRADLIVSDEKIDYPMVSEIDYLITLSQEGLDTNSSMLAKGASVFIENSLVDPSALKNGDIDRISAREIAGSLGNSKMTNVVMLGFFNQIAKLVSKESLEKAVKKRFPKFSEMNQSALEAGYKEAMNNV